MSPSSEAPLTVAIIAARAGSRRLPHKNRYPFFGKPMIEWVISAAKSARTLDVIAVSSDDQAILDCARTMECLVIRRPSELAEDDVPKIEAVRHAVSVLEGEHGLSIGIVASLQANSPELLSVDIDAAVIKLIDNRLWEVLSLDADLVGNGAFRIFRRSCLENTFGAYTGAVLTDYVDIHDLDDVRRAESRYPSRDDFERSQEVDVFIIADLFPQYGGDLQVAERMILECKLGGAAAVKLQLYPAAMFPGDDGQSRDYLEIDFDALARLKRYADNLGITLFATPFTAERLEWCKTLDFEYLKVAARMHRESPELVRTILDLGRPTFVSVPSDLDLLSFRTDKNATYLYCVSKYPTRLDEVRLPDFGGSIFAGISDHSLGIGAALVATARGARVLEKHYTLSTAFQKPTEKAHLGSMTLDELRLLHRLTGEMELVLAAQSAT